MFDTMGEWAGRSGRPYFQPWFRPQRAALQCARTAAVVSTTASVPPASLVFSYLCSVHYDRGTRRQGNKVTIPLPLDGLVALFFLQASAQLLHPVAVTARHRVGRNFQQFANFLESMLMPDFQND